MRVPSVAALAGRRSFAYALPVPPKAEGSISIGLALALLLVALLGAGAALGVALSIELAQGAGSWAAALAAVRADPLSIALCELAGLGLATGVGVIVSFGHDVRFRDALEVTPVPAAIAVLSITVGLALAFVLAELANLLEHLHPLLGLDAGSQETLRRAVRIDGLRDALTIPIAIVAIPAIAEELFFRGLLLPGLAQRHGPRVAIALSSVFYAIVHAMPGAILYAMVAGVVLGDLRRRTGSVLPCIALHGALSAVPLALPSELVPIPGFNVPDGHVPLALTVGALVVAVASLFVLQRMLDDPDDG